MVSQRLRIGIDLGGTKIEGIVLRGESETVTRRRVPTPAGDYPATLRAIAALVDELEAAVGVRDLPVGVGHPGAISPATGLIKNANSVCLNGRPLGRDLEAVLSRPVALANDANCLALSEVLDGAAAGCSPAFAVILGTGVGGAIAVAGHVIVGAQAIAGEWGHNPLPWPRADWDESPGPRCWCGRCGCLETWLSGPGLAADHRRRGGDATSAQAIVAAAEAGDPACEESLRRYQDRLARGLAHVVNLLDPEVIVLGGGLSRVERWYRQVPALAAPWIFSDRPTLRLVAARHGDASGVRGAARLVGEEIRFPTTGRGDPEHPASEERAGAGRSP